jgi:hypothetical protein
MRDQLTLTVLRTTPAVILNRGQIGEDIELLDLGVLVKLNPVYLFWSQETSPAERERTAVQKNTLRKLL